MKIQFIRLSSLFVLSLLTAPVIFAQSEKGYDEISIRSLDLRMMAERANRPAPSERRKQQALEELQEDFTRLQVINVDFVKSISAPKLDYKFVAKSASEINRRAGRLKDNLVLPAPTEKSVAAIVEATTELQMKKSMLRLGKLIYSFSHNPFFKEASVINDSAMQARRELDEILALSHQIKIDGEKFKKSSDNN